MTKKCSSECPFSRVIPNEVRNLQLGIRREVVTNFKRSLVAALLGMTKKCSSECPFSRVIPNEVRNLQLGIRREVVTSFKRSLVAALLGMTSRGAPRNAPFPAFIPNPASGGVRNPQLRNAFGMDDLDDLDDLEAAGGEGRKLRARIYSGKRCKIRGDSSSLRSSE
jgi:metal-sulfur cluster biosynthetic enzyme